MSTQPEPRYLTVNDVSMRVGGSVVRYEKKFYWASLSVDDNNLKIRLYNMSSQVLFKTVSANAPELDVTSPELGWMVLDGYPAYIARSPYRKQKQGICNENLVFYRVNRNGTATLPARVPNEFVYSKNFEEMLCRTNQDYAKTFKGLDKVLTLGGMPSGLPLALQYCLLKNGSEVHLYRRLTNIGVATAEGVSLLTDHRTTLNTMTLLNMGVPLV